MTKAELQAENARLKAQVDALVALVWQMHRRPVNSLTAEEKVARMIAKAKEGGQV